MGIVFEVIEIAAKILKIFARIILSCRRSLAFLGAFFAALHLAWVTELLTLPNDAAPPQIELHHDCPFTLNSAVYILMSNEKYAAQIRFNLKPYLNFDGTPVDLREGEYYRPFLRCSKIVAVSTSPIAGAKFFVDVPGGSDFRDGAKKAVRLTRIDDSALPSHVRQSVVGRKFSSSAIFDLSEVTRFGQSIAISIDVPIKRYKFSESSGKIYVLAVINRSFEVDESPHPARNNVYVSNRGSYKLKLNGSTLPPDKNVAIQEDGPLEFTEEVSSSK